MVIIFNNQIFFNNLLKTRIMKCVTKNPDPPARSSWNQMSASCIFLDQAKFQRNEALNHDMGAPILCHVLGHARHGLSALTVFEPCMLDSTISNLIACFKNTALRHANHV